MLLENLSNKYSWKNFDYTMHRNGSYMNRLPPKDM